MDGSKNRKKIIEKEIWTDKIKGKPLINVTMIYDIYYLTIYYLLF